MCGCCSSEPKDEQDSPGRQPFARKNVCCTDIIMLVLFIAFWGLMLYMAVYSVLIGDARRLVYGYDSFGNTCDEDNTQRPIANLSNSGRDMTGKPNVFFFYAFDPFDAMQICVEECPNRDLITPKDVQDFAKETGSNLCHYDIDVDDIASTNTQFDQEGPCPHLPVYSSLSVIQRCAPNPLVEANNNMDNERGNATNSFYEIFGLDDLFRKVLSDFYSTWREILVLCAAAVVLAFVMVLLIRYLAAIVVWIIVILSALGSLAGTAFLWWTYYKGKQDQNQDAKLHIPLLDVDVNNTKAFLVFSIIATVLTVLLLLILLVMRKRISLVVALFGEAGKAIASMPLLLVQPLLTFLFLAVFVVYWVIVLAFIATAGEPKANYDLNFVRVEYVLEGFPAHFWWIHLIGLIWTCEFILACQQFTIAGATATWYLTRDKKSLSCPIGKSVCRLIIHHIGSVAVGSFIITLVKIPRYILMYIKTKSDGSDNCCAKCCLKCCICCLWCLEKCLKYINHNAYTIIAIDGRSFCPAARKAFLTLTANVLRVAALNSVGSFVLFLGKIAVMAATCAISVLWLRKEPLHFYALPVVFICTFAFLISHCLFSVYESLDHVHYFAIPVLLLCVFSFLIAHCFLSVYEMVIDSLLLCFCWDSEVNDGVSPGKEYYMNASLMEFVKSSSKRLEGRKKDYIDATTEDEGRELKEMTA